MTTTMSFFNCPPGGKGLFFHLYRAGIKRCFGLGCLYAIFLQLTYTLPMFFSTRNIPFSWVEKPVAITTAQGLLSTYSEGAIIMTSALVCLSAVLFSTVIYSYMHNRRGADFYHSLPAPRPALLLANFAAVFTWLALPLLVSGSICLLFFPGFGVPVAPGAMIQAYFTLHGLWIVTIFILMSLTAFVAVNAATVVETAGYACAFSVMGSFLYYIWAAMCDISFSTYLTSPSVLVPNLLSPIFAAAQAILEAFRQKPDPLSFVPLGLWTLLGVGLLFGALICYRRRNSEIAQQWGYQSSLSFGVKVFASVLGAFILGGVFLLFMDLGLTTNILLSAALGAPLGYIVVEAITAKGFDTIKQALPKIGAATMAVLCCGTYFAFGGFGFDKKVPQPERVAAVELEGLNDFYGFTRLSDEDAQTLENANKYVHRTFRTLHAFTAPELIEAVTNLHRETVQREGNFNYHTSLELTYRLSPGGTMRRYLSRIPFEGLAALWQTPGYLQAANPFFELEPGYVTSAEVFDFMLESKGRLTEAQTAQLITAIRQDLEEQTLEQALDSQTNREVGIVRFYLKDNKQIYQETGNLFHYTEAFFYLRPQCKNTMALMGQWGYSGWELEHSVQKVEALEIIPQAISPQVSMPFPQWEDYGYYEKGIVEENSLQITDPAAIADILNSSTHLRNTTQGGQNLIYIHHAGTFYQPGGQSTTVYISNDQLTQLCKAHNINATYVLTAQDCEALLQANGGEKFPLASNLYDPDIREEWFKNNISLGEYCEQHLPQLLEGKSPAAREAMYRTPFLSQDGILLYEEAQIGRYLPIEEIYTMEMVTAVQVD